MKFLSVITLSIFCIMPQSLEAQRRNYAPRMVKLGDTINTTNKDAAMRLCHHWGGDHLIQHPIYGFDCFKMVR